MRISIYSLLAAVAIVVVAVSVPRRPLPPPPTGVNVAAIDTSINPCDDFYQYACGNWLATNPIPADQGSWGAFEVLAERNRADLRKILDQVSEHPIGESPLKQQVGDFYAACMNKTVIDAAGAHPLQSEMNDIASLTSKSQLAAEIARLQIDGADVLFDFGSDQDFKDANSEIAEADQGGLGLPSRSYYLKTDAKSVELRKQYVAHVATMFRLLGDPPAQAQQEAATVMRIETALAQGSMTQVQRRDPTADYHKMTVAQFEALAPDFDWAAYFAGSGGPAFTSINVVAPDFFTTVEQQLKTVSLADWKTYLRWHLVHFAAPALSQPFYNAYFAFYGTTLVGQKVPKPRWERCVASTDSHLGEALGRLYVRKYFSAGAKAHMEQMVQQLEAALGSDIESVDWMTPATKQQALIKLHAITNKIGYPDKWIDYSSIMVTRDNYFTDLRRTNAFEWHRQLNKIGKPVDRTEWQMTPPTVNAYYDPQFNEIVFPAGILQPPFYDANRDEATNFGGIGMVMGHELTHGFDDSGRKFGPHGNLRNWWTAADAKAFQERAACLINEYGNFSPVPGVKLNGKLTLGENTADNGGARIAYMAMEKALSAQPDVLIDGYTREQRYFIGFAQSFCENIRPQLERLYAQIDPHSPNRFRINGVVQNMPQFAQAFHCGPNAPLTAGGNACRVW